MSNKSNASKSRSDLYSFKPIDYGTIVDDDEEDLDAEDEDVDTFLQEWKGRGKRSGSSSRTKSSLSSTGSSYTSSLSSAHTKKSKTNTATSSEPAIVLSDDEDDNASTLHRTNTIPYSAPTTEPPLATVSNPQLNQSHLLLQRLRSSSESSSYSAPSISSIVDLEADDTAVEQLAQHVTLSVKPPNNEPPVQFKVLRSDTFGPFFQKYCRYKKINDPQHLVFKWMGMKLDSKSSPASMDMGETETIDVTYTYAAKPPPSLFPSEPVSSSASSSSSTNTPSSTSSSTSTSTTTSAPVSSTPAAAAAAAAPSAPDVPRIVLKVRLDGETYKFKIKRDDLLKKLLLGLTERVPGINLDKLKLTFDGLPLPQNETPDDLDMDDNDIIDGFLAK
eukprot:TRINITY_DN11122_c0_g1_i2.p1 TRINITY_DN11122_c0_g1~~TRINITY_DN11122_c0_g1_i2.p1  ORF type:complete len:405 (+),score=116.88 TRINITY_DN11122_c0_g1_i2:50-1216(+)